MLPWYQSNFNFPLSGNINQKIEPDWFFDAIVPEAKDRPIEKKAVMNIASYGKQIGIITKLLLSIAAESDKIDTKAFEDLKEIQQQINNIKSANKSCIHENAKAALDSLKDADPEALKKLIKEYQ